MSKLSPTFDHVWEDSLYGQGQHLARYPYDMVVSFVYRNYSRHKPRHETRILEVGCGAGNNLWFAAREGFYVAGIDGSQTAIAYAQRRFAEEALRGVFCVGDFTRLPFKENFFDLAIDRGALTCCGLSAASEAVAEVRRVLHPGGRFFCNPYSKRHSSAASGQQGPDGLRLAIDAGNLVGVGQICFYGRKEVDSLFAEDWTMLSVEHHEASEMLQLPPTIHADWRVVAEKLG